MTTYDPSQFISVFTAIPITGWSDAEFFSAERAEDSYSIKVGASGEGIFIRNRNRSGTITNQLFQDSLCNDLLSAVMELDDLTNAGVGPYFAKSLQGLETVLAGESRIMKPPAIKYAKDLSVRDWAFGCLSMPVFIGGIL
jgi:hypothetical protein